MQSLPPARVLAQSKSTQVVDAFRRPLRDLRISVTDKCNFRCPYCMPAEIHGTDYHFTPRQELMHYDEVVRLCQAAAANGVRKLRLTGGEPLLRKDLEHLIERLAKIDGIEDVTLTTNAWLLAARAKSLREAGLHRVTVSLDSLDPKVFARMNGRGLELAPVLAGIEAAIAHGLTPVKVNAVIQRSVNSDSILPLAKYFRGTGVIVRYIEYMDVGNRNGWRLNEVVPSARIRQSIQRQWPLKPVPPHAAGEVARRWLYVDGQGEIGFISSITEPFCGQCNRARLSADGRLITCLFAEDGPSLLAPLRSGISDEALCDLLASMWRPRVDRYSELRTQNSRLSATPKIEMFQIGG